MDYRELLSYRTDIGSAAWDVEHPDFGPMIVHYHPKIIPSGAGDILPPLKIGIVDVISRESSFFAMMFDDHWINQTHVADSPDGRRDEEILKFVIDKAIEETKSIYGKTMISSWNLIPFLFGARLPFGMSRFKFGGHYFMIHNYPHIDKDEGSYEQNLYLSEIDSDGNVTIPFLGMISFNSNSWSRVRSTGQLKGSFKIHDFMFDNSWTIEEDQCVRCEGFTCFIFRYLIDQMIHGNAPVEPMEPPSPEETLGYWLKPLVHSENQTFEFEVGKFKTKIELDPESKFKVQQEGSYAFRITNDSKPKVKIDAFYNVEMDMLVLEQIVRERNAETAICTAVKYSGDARICDLSIPMNYSDWFAAFLTHLGNS